MERQLAFRGNHSAKIDDKGRLKIPAEFRALLEAHFGPTSSVYITSDDDDGRYARVYPLSHWEVYETRLLQMPSSNDARDKLLNNVAYFGLNTQLDAQGRVLLPLELREAAGLTPEAEVYVMGTLECLTVWNQARLKEFRSGRRTTSEDRREREKFGL